MDIMSIKNKYAIFVMLSTFVTNVALAQFDSLQNYPFLYKYGWDSVGVENDGIMCFVAESLDNHNYGKEVVFLQHTDTPLRAVGIASGYQVSHTIYTNHLTIYGADLKTKIGELYRGGGFSNNWGTWQSDTHYHRIVIPGKTTPHPNSSPWTEMVLKYEFFDEPVEVNGDFYIGISRLYNSTEVSAPQITVLYELHEAPYHIGKTVCKYRHDSEWMDGDTLDGELPEVFLIIEPECQAVENITVTADSNGCLHAVWDSLPWQDLWVARLEGPSGVQYDTLDTTAHTYCDLAPDGHYSLSIQARCYRPGGHNWAQWSPSVSLGRAGIPFVTGTHARLESFPNPASKSLTVEGEDGRLQMLDLEGREVMACYLRGRRTTIDVSALPRGVYLLRLVSSEGTATRKVVLL